MPFLHENLIREACDCADEPHTVSSAESARQKSGAPSTLMAIGGCWSPCRSSDSACGPAGGTSVHTVAAVHSSVIHRNFEGRDRASRLTPHVSRIIYGSSAAIVALLERESD